MEIRAASKKSALSAGALALALAGVALLSLIGDGGSAQHEDASAAPLARPGPEPERVAGECGLGTFIRAMPCSRDVRSPACCAGLKAVFDNACACKPLPNVVASHGGSAMQFITDFMQCEYSDERGTPPVDHVSAQHECLDQAAWCADRLHNHDVRLTGWYLGLAQMHDALGGWQYVYAAEGEREHTAATLCRALGFNARPRVHGEGASPQPPTKHVSCSPEAAKTGQISMCEVRDVDKSTCGGSPCRALRLECAFEPDALDRSQFCVRVDQRLVARSGNRLQCAPSSSGMQVPGHTRRLGAAHAICGTAGINETRIRWSDGFHDDFTAYTATRLADGRFRSFEAYRGALRGAELLTPAELLVGSRRAQLHKFESRSEAASAVRAAMQARIDDVLTDGSDGLGASV